MSNSRRKSYKYSLSDMEHEYAVECANKLGQDLSSYTRDCVMNHNISDDVQLKQPLARMLSQHANIINHSASYEDLLENLKCWENEAWQLLK